MKLAIVTGASRGLGASVVETLHQQGFIVHGLARSISEDLANLENVYFHQVDLTDLSLAEKTLKTILQSIPTSELECCYLVQNAGLVTPIGPVSTLNGKDIETNVTLNLTAPIVLANAFLQQLEGTQTDKRMVHVTSGAAQTPVSGWSNYSSTKAGLNMFTKSVSAEQASVPNGAQACAFDPSIMDTDMQALIRSSSQEQFADIERFVSFKERDMLRPPSVVASALVKCLCASTFPDGEVVSVDRYLD
ncbi:SDR family NAD(P)-dependent oxidoreductase [Shouchella shacheensis]|uniref:SDR family NAD(P)-dependent oxidoreductase n=1 Tax=Shouchella shacheensis TaxID=1649580 RepID=UPI00073FDECD|nr:SDR family NAD(P)-dependent oxidoreductase [Shouchella shacheensis]